ncbi:class F sortase [Streptomyces alkaliterrae]|uniref:Class F sortase n=1 Tax=Streptomyces alkaliterrae TaxID=2213162 RepID=A0A5P0YZ31_9ACTN|nr:class F sortase [Streptomyces alkaliterrae]MBB1262489.1 class F sortase [Streptomyces alkaliterrae]MQS05523.1 class F sortase [Streptomyces alkaliterrae]
MDRYRRRRETLVATVVAAGLCGGVWLIDNSPTPERPPPQPSADGVAEEPRPARLLEKVVPLVASAPTRIRIPVIEVDAPITGLGLDTDGSLEPPPEDDPNLVGWYRDGTAPGVRGTAIFAGHVDRAEGPSVFYGLGALRKGNRVEVARRDGRTAVFTVYAIEVYGRDDFPDQRVYGSTGRPEIRLITCGGGYSHQEGYLGNVVVYGRLAEVREG